MAPHKLDFVLDSFGAHNIAGASTIIITKNPSSSQISTTMDVQKDRIEELEERIAELKARLPRHSVPPSMLMELEELEDELAQLVADEDVPDGRE